MAEHEPFADRVCSREKKLRRACIYHRHAWKILAVGIRELPPTQEPDAESLPIIPADDVDIRMRKAARLRQGAFYRNVGARMIVGEWNRGPHRRGFHARQRADPV